MTALVDPLAIAFAVSSVLESLGIAHTIGGSLASSFAGEPRSTVDIDFVVAFDESHVPALVSALDADFFVDEGALRRAVRERGSANLIHQATQLKVDLFVAGGAPLDQQQLDRRMTVLVGPGRTIPVHPPKTSCCRNFAGIVPAEKRPTGNGGMFSASFEFKAPGSIGNTFWPTRRHSAWPIPQCARFAREPPRAYEKRSSDRPGPGTLSTMSFPLPMPSLTLGCYLPWD